MSDASLPHVDVILPTHDGLPWVDEAIASVLGQTHPKLTLFVVDDASEDGTFAHVSERWTGDPRVEPIALDASLRAAGARMRAVAAGGGDWLAFIDQDDRWHPEKLERQLRRASEAPEIAVVHTDCEHIAAEGAPLPGSAAHENRTRAAVAWDALSGDALARACFRANRIRLASALVQRRSFEAVGGFDATLFGGEDWDLWVRLASAGARIAHLPEPLLERRVHPRATSTARRAERIDGLYHALDRATARDPSLAAARAGRIDQLLRRELESLGGSAVRHRLRERGSALPAHQRVRHWLLSFAGGLVRAAARLRAQPRGQA